jgi:hypothetical protein
LKSIMKFTTPLIFSLENFSYLFFCQYLPNISLKTTFN